jgi:hypothetical protein
VSVARPSDRGTAPYPLLVRLGCALAILACATAAGCASASIGLQKDGTYNLELSEQAMDCTRLSNGIWGRLQVLKALPAKAKAERDTAAPTAVQAFSRWFGGSNKGLASLEEYDRERAHVRSLHGVLIAKGCPPLDIERELAATDADIAQYR